MDKMCVNPYHIQCVQILRDDYETIKYDPSYGYPDPLRYVWPDEFEALRADHTEEELKILRHQLFGSPSFP